MWVSFVKEYYSVCVVKIGKDDQVRAIDEKRFYYFPLDFLREMMQNHYDCCVICMLDEVVAVHPRRDPIVQKNNRISCEA